MTALYPRERVEAVVQPLNGTAACRLLWKQYLSDPLAVHRAPSRFCDGRSYGVLYAALEFETAFIEVVVRDHFVQRSRRILPLDDVQQRGWVEFDTPRDSPLLLLDLRESGCVKLGIPTDAVHARNQAAGRALGRRSMSSTPISMGSAIPLASPAGSVWRYSIVLLGVCYCELLVSWTSIPDCRQCCGHTISGWCTADDATASRLKS